MNIIQRLKHFRKTLLLCIGIVLGAFNARGEFSMSPFLKEIIPKFKLKTFTLPNT